MRNFQFSIFNFQWQIARGQLQPGFTLIELLVVISIVGVLASLVLVAYAGVQKQSRDAQRRSDLKQYQTSLESFANRNNGFYPQRNSSGGVSAGTTLCADLGLSGCPQDPRNSADSSFDYKYQSDGSGSDGSAVGLRYVLWVKLENTTDYIVVCSSGATGAKSQSTWTNPSGGVCPL